MAGIKALAGWRYNTEKADLAACVAPPYDVIEPDGQEALYRQSPYNCIRLILGREEATDNAQVNKYSRAAGHLAEWRASGVLKQDAPSFYVYEQRFSWGGTAYVRRGFLARVCLERFNEGTVFPHERTLAGPKVDRLNLMRATQGNMSPVFGLLTDEDNALSAKLDALCATEPEQIVTEDSGVENRFWVLTDPAQVAALEALGASRRIFIADGHHRYETAVTYRDEVRDARKAAGQPELPYGELPSDYVLMMCVPISDPGLAIFPTHRLVHDVKHFDAGALMRGLEQHFTVVEMEPAAIEKALEDLSTPCCFGLVLAGKNYLLTLKNAAVMRTRASGKPEAWQKLDVAVLHLLILEDLLGIDEGRLLRKENIVYIRDNAESFRRANEDASIQATFLMRTCTMDDVRDVCLSGEVMPQKSTYFYPKVLSGAVLHLFA